MLTDEQRAMRRTGITATDIAAIVGVSPWKTPLQVWCEKMGADVPATGDDIERGEFLEDGARRWYAHRTGAVIEQPGTLRHPTRPLVLATPDGLVTLPGARKVLEIKMPRGARGWGEPGTDEIPQHYLLQVAFQIAVTAHMGVTEADVFAVLGGAPTIYHVTSDREIEEMLCEAAERFWRDHVEPRRPPPVTEPLGDMDAVGALYPRHEGEAKRWEELPDGDKHDVAQWLRAKARQRSAAADEAALEARVRMLLGTTPSLLLPDELGGGRVDWKQNKATTKTDWERIVREVLPAYVSPEAYKETLKQFTTTKEGARPLVVRQKEEGR